MAGNIRNRPGLENPHVWGKSPWAHPFGRLVNHMHRWRRRQSGGSKSHWLISHALQAQNRSSGTVFPGSMPEHAVGGCQPSIFHRHRLSPSGDRQQAMRLLAALTSGCGRGDTAEAHALVLRGNGRGSHAHTSSRWPARRGLHTAWAHAALIGSAGGAGHWRAALSCSARAAASSQRVAASRKVTLRDSQCPVRWRMDGQRQQPGHLQLLSELGTLLNSHHSTACCCFIHALRSLPPRPARSTLACAPTQTPSPTSLTVPAGRSP